MSARELPARPNLEQYKKQAKDLLKASKRRCSGGTGANAETSTVERQAHTRRRAIRDCTRTRFR